MIGAIPRMLLISSSGQWHRPGFAITTTRMQHSGPIQISMVHPVLKKEITGNSLLTLEHSDLLSLLKSAHNLNIYRSLYIYFFFLVLLLFFNIYVFIYLFISSLWVCVWMCVYKCMRVFVYPTGSGWVASFSISKKGRIGIHCVHAFPGFLAVKCGVMKRCPVLGLF